MASLLNRVKNLFKRSQPDIETTELSADVLLKNTPIESIDLFKQMAADQERIAIMKTCRTMYATDSRVKKSHRFYARDIVRSGFLVKTKNEQAKEIADALQKRLGLNQIMEDAVRLTSRDGDSFYEIVIDESMQISEVSRKPTLQMRRNSDKRDKFPDTAKAFWQSLRPWFEVGVPKDVLWYAKWQMIHMRWEYDHETRYGTPMYSSSTGAFKKVKDGELNLAVRRKLGSAQIRQHTIEGGPADVESYKEDNKAALGKLAAVIDFFSNKTSSLFVHQGDGNLDKIGDINHHVATMMTASDVPMELIVYGGDLNRDILGEKKEEYEETLSQGREWLTAQLINPLLEREWLLHGILPDDVNYEIVWRTAKPLTPADMRDLADALSRFKLLGLDDDVIKQIAAMFLKNVDVDVLKTDGFDVAQFAQNLKGVSV